MAEITLTIDGKKAKGSLGDTVLDVCDKNGIYVPTLCTTEVLSRVGACRMCIVEIEGGRRPVSACTTPAADGMVVFTQTEKIVGYRRMILELLFAERNHICPFCEMSGDCELQDLAYKHGMDGVRFEYLFPSLKVDTTHEYMALDHNRCILCTRCIRACAEIAGNHTLDLKNRGHRTLVGVDLNSTFADSTCVSCGMCVQVCPTGALFEKYSAYKGKVKESRSVQTVCSQCPVGCGLVGYANNEFPLKVYGDFSSPVNEGMACVEGRHEPFTRDARRILAPMIRKNGELTPVSWEEAVAQIAPRLAEAALDKSGIALASPYSTNEALTEFKRLFGDEIGIPVDSLNSYEMLPVVQALKDAAIDLPVGDFEAGMKELKESDCFILIGCDPHETHPVIGMLVKRKVIQAGAKLIIINPRRLPILMFADEWLKLRRGTDSAVLKGLIGLINDGDNDPERVELLSGVNMDSLKRAAEIIAASANPIAIYGRGITNQNDPDLIKLLIELIKTTGNCDSARCRILGLRTGTNHRGVSDVRLDTSVAHRTDIASMKFAFVMLGEKDQIADEMMEELRAVRFLAVQSPYWTKLVDEAEVVLPSTIWSEREGTYTNFEGRVQHVRKLVDPKGDVKQDWEIISTLRGAIKLGESGGGENG